MKALSIIECFIGVSTVDVLLDKYSGPNFKNVSVICREDVTQTTREDGSSVPKPSTYIVGLRGKDIAPQTVDLTLSIDVHNNITT